MTNNHSFKKLTSAISTFVEERDWARFHSPKNLAMALSVEAAELVEIFQWQTEDESRCPDKATLVHIEEEIGDVMIYLTMLARHFAVDPIAAANSKMQKNKKKYPAERLGDAGSGSGRAPRRQP